MWSFKVDVVKVLLAGDIDLDLRDSGDKTVLDIMEDIKTPVSVEITDVIIGEPCTRYHHLRCMQCHRVDNTLDALKINANFDGKFIQVMGVCS